MATKSNSLLLDPQLHSFARAYMWQLLRQGKFAEPATEPLHVLAQELAQAIAADNVPEMDNVLPAASLTIPTAVALAQSSFGSPGSVGQGQPSFTAPAG